MFHLGLVVDEHECARALDYYFYTEMLSNIGVLVDLCCVFITSPTAQYDKQTNNPALIQTGDLVTRKEFTVNKFFIGIFIYNIFFSKTLDTARCLLCFFVFSFVCLFFSFIIWYMNCSQGLISKGKVII